MLVFLNPDPQQPSTATLKHEEGKFYHIQADVADEEPVGLVDLELQSTQDTTERRS